MGIFDAWKKRKVAYAKQEAAEIGTRHVELFNAALEEWRATSLDMRRTMLEDMFAERLVELWSEDVAIGFEETAQIEGLALMTNWVENTPKYAGEFMDRLSQETIDVLEAFGAGDEAAKHVNRHLDEVRRMLELEIDRTIAEAVSRHERSSGTA
jgi:hypothetical protein